MPTKIVPWSARLMMPTRTRGPFDAVERGAHAEEGSYGGHINGEHGGHPGVRRVRYEQGTGDEHRDEAHRRASSREEAACRRPSGRRSRWPCFASTTGGTSVMVRGTRGPRPGRATICCMTSAIPAIDEGRRELAGDLQEVRETNLLIAQLMSGEADMESAEGLALATQLHRRVDG